MRLSLFDRALSVLRRWLRVPYEIRIRLALGLLLIVMLAASLNVIRFFNQSRELLHHDDSYQLAMRLGAITDLLQVSPAEKLGSSRLRELTRISGFETVKLVETDVLRAKIAAKSDYLTSAELMQIQEQYRLSKRVIGDAADGLPSVITESYQSGELWFRSVFHPFRTADGQELTLIAVESSEADHFLNQLWLLTLAFQILALLTGAIIGLMLLRITYAPYRKITHEAIAAEIAPPDEPEAVDFAVETFLKVIADLKSKEQRLAKLYADQQQRAASLERYNEYVLESMPSGVISCDTGGLITQVNRAAARILKIKQRELIGRRHVEALRSLRPLTNLFDHALQTGEENSVTEATLQVDDDGVVHASLICRLLHDTDGKVRGAMILITDLTTIRELEAEVSFREEMASLGELSAGLAHQLRNSLAAMVGFAQLLHKLTRGNDQSEQIAASILRESEATEKMLRQFLNYASPGELKIQEVNFNDLIAQLEQHFAGKCNKAGVTLSFKLPSGLPILRCDPLLMSNVLQNLIQNGIEACRQEGHVDVVADYDIDREQFVIEVIDDGVGMSSEVRSKVFNPFYTSGKSQGSGLGLSLARKWILNHKGQICCSSSPGKGTSFRIILPQPNVSQPTEPIDSSGRRSEIGVANV
jgi:PAS domain S-box-containing protein